MLTLETIIKDVKDISACKQIRPFDLKELGYIVSKKKLRIYNTSYGVHEVLDLDTKRPVSFCFLLSRKILMGIVLPNDYRYYQLAANQNDLKGPDEDSEDKNPSSNRKPKDK